MITRRNLLKGAAGAAGALASIGNISLALAGTSTDRRLVVVILRGGADGLALVPAPGDPDFGGLRDLLAKQDHSTDNISLDGFFALHPKLTGLASMWHDKHLAVVHATQTGYRDRSHFDAQDILENGLGKVSGLTDGWLNRALGYFGETEPRIGLAVGHGTPLILRGQTPIATWAPRRLPRPNPRYLTKLMAISSRDPEISRVLREGIRIEKANRRLLGHLEESHPGTNKRQAVADLARATGRLLSAEEGPRVAALGIDGWDTHGSQNIVLSYLVPVLDDALLSLKAGLGSAWTKTAVIVVSEFGRTAAPNGTNGTDHGTAGAMLLLGGAVRGGQVLADWPGLAKSSLYEGRDLMPTTDVRAVFKGVIVEHLGIDAAFVEERVFPDSPSVRPLENLVVV